jgi:KDO2-lipid IV(A) lauroyltransferase
MSSDAAEVLRPGDPPPGAKEPEAIRQPSPRETRSLYLRVRHLVEYAAVLALSLVSRALPRRGALALGAAIGQLGWWLPLRKRMVLSNLRQALPELTEKERRRVGARAARNFGRTAVEFLRFPGRDRRSVAELVAVSGLEDLRTSLAAGRGVLVVAAHLGAWALYVPALTARGVPTALLVGRQHNPSVDRLILGLPGPTVRFISKGPSSPRGVLRCLAEGRAVVVVADQRSPRGMEVPFLGRPASTLPLPAAIAARHGTPLFLLEGHREEDGRHRAELHRLPAVTAGAEPERRAALAALINEELGRAILRHPDQYFWYHDRWRLSLEPDA